MTGSFLFGTLKANIKNAARLQSLEPYSEANVKICWLPSDFYLQL